MVDYYDESTVETELTRHIKEFGNHLRSIVEEKKIDYLVPLESKGALLVDIACSDKDFGSELRIIYPNGLRYLPKEKIINSRFLLVDDIFYSGNHLGRIYKQILSYGAQFNNIECVTFLDFSSGVRDKDYDGYMHSMISKNVLDGPPLERKRTLLFLQKEMLEKSMPSVYDHLTIEAHNVGQDCFFGLLRAFSQKNRLLYYGKRGAYQACSVLIDDLFDGDWDVPPKIRFWWHEKKEILRVTPVGFVANHNNAYQRLEYFNEIQAVLVGNSQSTIENDINEASYESLILATRMEQLNILKNELSYFHIDFNLDITNLNRYYPEINITSILRKILIKERIVHIPSLQESYEDTGYNRAISAILRLINKVYKDQDECLPKDRKKKGYTATELFSMLSDFSKPEIHSAIDYCFDFHFLAVFRNQDNNGFSRCYRTTEITRGHLPSEVFGASVIYSASKPIPDWFIHKIFPIISSITPGLIYGGQLAITKAYFGDITRIKESEESYINWKDVQSDLWTVETAGKGVLYKKKNDAKTLEKVIEIMDDPRLSGYRDTIDAVVYLLERGGRDAAVCLDILTRGYGGAEYITYNLSKLLSAGTRLPDEYNTKRVEWHSIGAEEKLNLILSIFENDENILTKLKRYCSSLDKTFNVKLRALKAINQAKTLESRLLYDALIKLKKGISGAVLSAQKNHYKGFLKALQELGFKEVPKSSNLRNLLSKAGSVINPVLYAISGQTFPSEYYRNRLLSRDDTFNFILGYDLTGERRKLFENDDELTRYDEHLHKFIANWIIAFNGKISSCDTNSGDLRFGFFFSVDDAINCSCWLLHHLEQLSYAGAQKIGSRAVSIVITSGTVKVDDLGNPLGQALDFSGHWLKGKIKERQLLDKATGIVGREEKSHGESQVWLMETDSFEIDKSRRNYFGKDKVIKHNDTFLRLAPVSIDLFFKTPRNPWSFY